MPTKMRLQRRGKRNSSYFHIVIADNRAPRDGKFIEKIGTYNPNTNPASIDLKFDRALNWLSSGAEPSDTVKAILSYEGVLYRNHLNKGVAKGAFSMDEADKRFKSWKDEKLGKIQKKIEGLQKSEADKIKSMIEAEETVNRKREQEIMTKTATLAEEARKASEASRASAEAEKAAVQTEEVSAEVTDSVSGSETSESNAEEAAGSGEGEEKAG